MLVTEERVDKAMHILAETDLEIANWKVAMLRGEHMAKAAEALVFQSLRSSQDRLSLEDCKQAVRLDESVKQAWETYFKAVSGYETCRARREREVLVIELFRTLESSRRQGAIK